MRKSKFIPPTKGKATTNAIGAITDPIVIEDSIPPETYWINMELVAFSEAGSERNGEINELAPDHYEKMVSMEESEMRGLTRMVLYACWTLIQKIVNDPEGDDDQIFSTIRTQIYLVLRGNLSFNRYYKYYFLKPVGAELTYDLQRQMMERIRSDHNLHKEEFIAFVKRGNERERKERLMKKGGA